MVDKQHIQRMDQAQLEALWDDMIDAEDSDDELIDAVMDRLDFLTGVSDGQRVLALEEV